MADPLEPPPEPPVDEPPPIDSPYLSTPAEIVTPDPETVTGPEQSRYEVLTGLRVQKADETVEAERTAITQREELEAAYRERVAADEESRLAAKRQ